jgi:urease accessory protein
MRVAEPIVRTWKASLALGFSREERGTVLSRKAHDGPLVVQKPLYPEGSEVCHAIVVHPPGGIAGGDELEIEARVGAGAAALLTTPGAAKWYRSSGPRAAQRVTLEVDGALEWLPQEAIVFDGALVETALEARLSAGAALIGWDIVCLGRIGSGERYARGAYRGGLRVLRERRLLWQERGRVAGGGGLLDSPAGLAGAPVFGTLFASYPGVDGSILPALRDVAPEAGEGAATLLPGILLVRYRGDSTEAARRYFAALWRLLRPAALSREAREPRIWRT